MEENRRKTGICRKTVSGELCIPPIKEKKTEQGGDWSLYYSECGTICDEERDEHFSKLLTHYMIVGKLLAAVEEQWWMFALPYIYDRGSLLTLAWLCNSLPPGTNYHTVDSLFLLNDCLFSSIEVLITLNCIHGHYARVRQDEEGKDNNGWRVILWRSNRTVIHLFNMEKCVCVCQRRKKKRVDLLPFTSPPSLGIAGALNTCY